jgi:hypothetical protein
VRKKEVALVSATASDGWITIPRAWLVMLAEPEVFDVTTVALLSCSHCATDAAKLIWVGFNRLV